VQKNVNYNPPKKEITTQKTVATPPSKKAPITPEVEQQIKMISEKQIELFNKLYEEYLEKKGTKAKSIQYMLDQFKVKEIKELSSRNATNLIGKLISTNREA